MLRWEPTHCKSGTPRQGDRHRFADPSRELVANVGFLVEDQTDRFLGEVEDARLLVVTEKHRVELPDGNERMTDPSLQRARSAPAPPGPMGPAFEPCLHFRIIVRTPHDRLL